MQASPHVEHPASVRRAIRVRGTVQGVGFRPYVHRLAHALGVAGRVCNDGDGVWIEAEGDPARVERLIDQLARQAPRLARVDSIAVTELEPQGDREFTIDASLPSAAATSVPADAAICEDCLRELFDPADRRYRYPFINCVQCGPRFTLTHALPYDRSRTTMAAFELCPRCRHEYEDPQTRRFHAEPNACPACGPRLWLVDASGHSIFAADPVARAWELIRQGRIVAMRSLGGFHLACDARNAATVARLRQRKQRDAKPFALMVLNAAGARRWARVDAAEASLLQSPARPIVLLQRRSAAERLGDVAPGLDRLGLMLPYTPLHYLLFHAALGAPGGTDWLQRDSDIALVMTSANPHGEPLVRDNDEALQRLSGIADALLLHDRPIAVRCDDSVVRLPSFALRASEGEPAAASHAHGDEPPQPLFVRRARGYTPAPIRLSRAGPSVLALGGHFKNTICATRGAEAFVSQHLGDTDNAPARRLVEEAVAHWQAILALCPQAIACDLHPDYASSALAATTASRLALPLIPVQHHHAHIGAVLAEHRFEGAALGVALDGVGMGTDGTPWGGELLRVDGAVAQRLSHLRALPLPGGDAAAREPWRMGAAVLHLLGRDEVIATRYAQHPAARHLGQMLARNVNCPESPSMGRWFDAAAALLGVATLNSYEGQAAMQLEALAQRHGPVQAMQPLATVDARGQLDLLPLAAALVDEPDPARGAARFHAALVDGLDRWIMHHARRAGLSTVALGGGCFLNAILAEELTRRLCARGMQVLAACQVPPNDGGLSLGQAWVAQRMLQAAPARAARSA